MKKVKLSTTCFTVCLVTSVALMVTGFFLPPPGVIDGSVQSSAGILFGFAALALLPDIIHGRNVKIEHGNTTIIANKELPVDTNTKQERYGTEIPYSGPAEDPMFGGQG